MSRYPELNVNEFIAFQKRTGLLWKTIARHTGISPVTMSKIKNGKRKTTIRQAIDLKIYMEEKQE